MNDILNGIAGAWQLICEFIKRLDRKKVDGRRLFYRTVSKRQ